MFALILKRLISLPFVILAVTFLTFIVGYFAPGDPILNLMGNQRDQAIYERLRTLYGLDLPWHEQYLRYVVGLLQGDFGLSYRFAQRPVIDLIRDGLPVSLLLGLNALLFSLALGVPLGVLAALRHNTVIERVIMALILALYAVPSFVLIPLLQWLNYQVYLARGSALPAAGWGRPEHWIMPTIVLAAASLGYIARITRASMLETLGQDYIRTAQSKGLRWSRIQWVHLFRNAILPILTVVGPAIAFLVTGAFVIETLFSIPGIGFLSVEAISQRDYPVIQGTTVILALAVVVMSLITDLLYVVFDPRIRVNA
ncbi:MAG: ABC transporter permease [Chloroflexota bacterium]|nr:ABC transporter permease [Chloroflexota bacterium]